jgi:hypothetical protein
MLRTHLYAIVILLISVIVGCKPANITDPISTMVRITMESNSEEFIQGILELHVPYEGISFREVYLSIERQEVVNNEPYVVCITEGTDTLFNKTITVSDDAFTELTYESMNISCSNPSLLIFLNHPAKVHSRIVIYNFN